MKKLIVLSLLVTACSQVSFAKIWRVNNMPGVTADFTTPQQAHDAASAGDTIHLEPSVTTYGGVTCSKKLVWLSIGSFLPQHPGNQYSTISAILSTMYFNPGSEGSVASVVSNSSCNISASNVSLVRSRFESGASVSADNVLVTQCYFPQPLSVSGNNHVITNNIIAYISMSGNSSAVITNNMLIYSSGTVNIYNSVFQNNIVYGITYAFNNSNVSYNIHGGSGLPAGNNNQLNVDLATVFETWPPSEDGHYRLKTGSPAIAAGFGGVDMGAFGGTTPYKLALQPAIPAITNLSTPSSSGSNTIQVTFSAKSNN